jgi:predicted nucleic acid-binding protein
VKISAALIGVRQLYIETAPFIYYVEDHALYADKVESILDIVNAGTIEVFTSAITLTEVLTKPIKTGDKTVEQAYRVLLQHTKYITLMPITVLGAERAADIRARYNLRTPDALHIAAALETYCDAFLTNDLTLRRVTELRVLALDDLELDLA